MKKNAQKTTSTIFEAHKTDFIKLGLVCLLSSVVLSACVKKEEPKDNAQQETAQTESNTAAPIPSNTHDEPEYTTLEEVPTLEINENRAEQTATIDQTINNAEQTAVANTSPTSTSPAPISHPESSTSAQQNNAAASTRQQNVTAAPAQATSNQHDATGSDDATVDDAIAAAMKAAQPALQQ